MSTAERLEKYLGKAGVAAIIMAITFISALMIRRNGFWYLVLFLLICSCGLLKNMATKEKYPGLDGPSNLEPLVRLQVREKYISFLSDLTHLAVGCGLMIILAVSIRARP